jgi:hypothetical protein
MSSIVRRKGPRIKEGRGRWDRDCGGDEEFLWLSADVWCIGTGIGSHYGMSGTTQQDRTSRTRSWWGSENFHEGRGGEEFAFAV